MVIDFRNFFQLRKTEVGVIPSNRVFGENMYSFSNMKGKNPDLRAAVNIAMRAVNTNLCILICGETGTGKEVFAAAVHNESFRKNKHFVKINSASIPDNLIESELFGYEKGAFTGALKSKKGKFEIADGGTLFFDEIGDMSFAMQSKVLTAIESNEITPLGSNKTHKTDVRLVCATNKDLKRLVSEGSFREDLYYRIGNLNINLPPLRNRKDEIKALANYFVEAFCKVNHLKPKSFSDEAKLALENYEWPGNIRELKSFCELALITSTGELIEINDLPNDVFVPNGSACHSEVEEQLTRLAMKNKLDIPKIKSILIKNYLKQFDGNKSKVSKLLNISRNHFYNKN